MFLDKELAKLQLKSNGKDRIADILVQLYLKNGKEVWVFLHIEVQGYIDKTFSLRVHQMRYRIEDRFGINPVMLVIYTDDNDNFCPNQYKVDTWGSTNRTTFLTYKVKDCPPTMFPNTDNPVSIIMEVAYHATQAKKTSDEDMMKLHLPIVKKLLTKGYSKEQIKALISFIEGYIKFGNSKNKHIFVEKIDDHDSTCRC